MGIFSERDIVIAISKSGNTSELIAFVLALRKQGFTNIIGVTANKKSQLCNLSNLCLAVDIANEGDQFNLAPIASTMIFGSLLDSIAVEISFSKGYTKEDFIRNHPGGELGKTRV
jgi:arabinose-5-phosphate isomerase